MPYPRLSTIITVALPEPVESLSKQPDSSSCSCKLPATLLLLCYHNLVRVVATETVLRIAAVLKIMLDYLLYRGYMPLSRYFSNRICLLFSSLHMFFECFFQLYGAGCKLYRISYQSITRHSENQRE